jgi:hypothetical protein
MNYEEAVIKLKIILLRNSLNDIQNDKYLSGFSISQTLAK